MAARRKVTVVIGHRSQPQPEREPPICVPFGSFLPDLALSAEWLICAPPTMGLMQRRAMPLFRGLSAPSTLLRSAVLRGAKDTVVGRWRVPGSTVAGHSQAGLPRREACTFSESR